MGHTVAAFKLVEVGFTKPQVEALAEFLDTQAVTNADLVAQKLELNKWMIGVAFVQTGIILAVIKLFMRG